MTNKQRILLVDDHEVVRLGLKALLERHPNFEVIAEASTAREAVERVAAFTPDVVVMDIRLPGGSGIEACQEIVDKYPDTKVIMLTSYAEDEMLFSAIRAGAAGYVLSKLVVRTSSEQSKLSRGEKPYWIQLSPSVYSRKYARLLEKKRPQLFQPSPNRNVMS